MGCGTAKQNIIIEVSYCGGVGWTVPARRVCQSIKTRLPLSVIDCRPEQVFTGVLQVSLLIGDGPSKQKKSVYKGDKETVLASVENISQQVEQAYNLV